MRISERTLCVEWGDCDPAGIVFYPRYFAYFDTSTTVLFERALGMTKYELLKTYDFLGYPMVDARARFLRPNRFRDEIVIETTMAQIKRSSFSLTHRILRAGELTVEGFETRVWTVRDPADPERIRSRPIPPDVVARLSA